MQTKQQEKSGNLSDENISEALELLNEATENAEARYNQMQQLKG